MLKSCNFLITSINIVQFFAMGGSLLTPEGDVSLFDISVLLSGNLNVSEVCESLATP